MIKIYGYPKSRSTRALWAAEETGIEYEFVKVDLPKGRHQVPPFTGLNPTAKVPVLEDDGLILTESPAICTYIGQQDKSKGLVPDASPAARALYDKWCCFVISELEQPLWTIAKHSFALPEQVRVPEIKSTARYEFQLVLRSLSVQLGDNEFITAGRFTVADILIAHTLMWALAVKQGLRHANLKGYLRRTTVRKALQRARQKELGH